MNLKDLKLLSLGVGLLTMLSLEGCRFGNYSEPPKVTPKFSSVEVFNTQAKKFEVFVFYQDSTNSSNNTTPLSAIPSTILDNFSDPLYIAQPVTTPGVKMFIGARQTDCFLNPDTSSCIGTLIDSQGNIGVQTSSPLSQFGSDPACQMKLQMQQVGFLDRSHPSTITYSDGSTGKVAGDLVLDFQMIRSFQGDCSKILTILAGCYNSGVGCSTDELYWANQLFDLYVRQSGALKIEDATKIKSLAYVVHFD